MTTLTKAIGILAMTNMAALALADRLYSGTWNVSGNDAGTLTLRIDGDRVTGALVDGKDDQRTGHLKGSINGKRFMITVRLSDGTVRQFQGNITSNETEAHMDGLLYHGDKPDTETKFTVDTKSMKSGGWSRRS